MGGITNAADRSTTSKTYNNPGVKVDNTCKVSVLNSATNKLVGVANIGKIPTNVSSSISQGSQPLLQSGIKKASIEIFVQNPPQLPPRNSVLKQASVQNPPQLPPRNSVHTQASVQNTPQPASPGAEDTWKPELKREVLLQPETKVTSNPKSHVSKNATIQAENVAMVKNDVVKKKNDVPEKKPLKNKILHFFHIHRSKNALLNVEQRKALAYENRDSINNGVRNILALDEPKDNGSTRLEEFGVFREAHSGANNTQRYFQQTIKKMDKGNKDLLGNRDDVVAFFNIFKYAINQAYSEMKSGQDKETAKDAFNEMVSLLGSMQQHFANADKNTYNFNNVAQVMFRDMPEVLSHLNLEKPTFNLPDSQ